MSEYEDDDILREGEEAESEKVGSAKEGRFSKLLSDGSRRYKLSGMFKEWFLDYSSYVILQRAVPHIVDGLKPVQRRVLQAMYVNDDGSRTKAAKTVGQVMAYHPHGDQSIFGALVQLGQKGLLIDTQGNWGNIITGDPNAAGRYIECRLTRFAKEVVFNPKTTTFMKTYDGKLDEPVELPVKFPLLLAQGADGIAVGLASKILPHNFNELIDASIAILEGRDFEIYPDFPTGGYLDCSKYNCGHRGGVVKVRAKIEKIDKNTIEITEVPFSKTTGMICDSIIKAKEKGKIKIKKIDDLTTKTAKIVIHLPNDVSPDKTIDALYAFTDCEVSISPNACVIIDHKPEFIGVDDILRYSTDHTRSLLMQEQEIRLNELGNDWHNSSLERIFFENKVYQLLENESSRSWEDQLSDVFSRMKEFQHLLQREITMDDILRLVEKPVRKISKFDVKAVEEKLRSIEEEMARVRDNIEHITEFTINWFRSLGKKYGADHPRLTEITSFESITATRVVSNNAKLYANLEEGFVGINLKKDDNGEYICDCSDLSEIIIFRKDGTYMVTKVTDKAFYGKDLLYAGVFDRNDERTIYNCIYRDGKNEGRNGADAIYYAKRFAVTSVTRDKEYDITAGTPGSSVIWFTVNHNGEAETVRIRLRPRLKLKRLVCEYDFSKLAIKGKASRGNIVSKTPIQSIQLKSKGISTIGGKDIWFDEDIQRLNEDSRGLYLGQFLDGDHILAVFTDGSYYTTNFDLSVKYQGELLRIEKFEPGKTFTVLYWDNEAEAFYIKRFSFEVNDNNPLSFIGSAKGSKLIALSDDLHPQVEAVFAGKWEHREPEHIDAEEFIAKKGIGAKGKKVSPMDLKEVRFIEPLHKEGDEEIENQAGDISEEVPESAGNVDVNSPDASQEGTSGNVDSSADGQDGMEALDLTLDDEPTLF